MQSSQICRVCSSLQKLAYEYFCPHFEKQDYHSRHRQFFDGHQGVLHIMRLFLINRKLNLFMIGILIEIFVLYSLQTFDTDICPSRSALDL